ncbi:hypothetical protein CLOSYM_00405 [[Clostridium] symbiosum ATCC 14940]|uniref:Uncharacterized protein n=1 Tax=[Clostridium] symbiosum ATCC 14940 TaxID=411472 RepID=A0ABC9U363_CLOSY|nr:hypothetical protein CLOSYM_00405 [[Clostridium] symbiosum ATCC 14940]
MAKRVTVLRTVFFSGAVNSDLPESAFFRQNLLNIAGGVYYFMKKNKAALIKN